ncbi:MAG: hypothetical protein HYV09_24720 [Deltaproteobacteria bacterium]|nr:hypothetical protein [Deltaproteobacteria bacterium]
MSESESADGGRLVRIAVKSRTGSSYFRGSRPWPADQWARVEVAADEAATLRGDAWLDVRDLEAAERADAPTLEDELAAARAEIASLRGRLEAIAAEHGAELVALRDAHAKELAALATRRKSDR